MFWYGYILKVNVEKKFYKDMYKNIFFKVFKICKIMLYCLRVCIFKVKK